MNVMSFFRRQRVRTQLSLAFGVLGVACLVIAVYGRWALFNAEAQMQRLSDQGVQRVMALHQVRDNVNLMLRSATNILLVMEDDTKSEQQKHIEATRTRVGELLAKLDGQLKGSDLAPRLQAVHEAGERFRVILDKAVESGMVNQNSQAASLLMGDGAKLQATYVEAIDSLVAAQEAQSEALLNEAHRAVTSAARIMVGIALASVAIGLLAAWAMARQLSTQLGAEPAELAALASSVARGELGIQVATAAGGSVQHALGSMVASLRQMVSQVHRSTDSIHTASSEIASGNADLSARTERTAANLQQAASSAEQLASGVRQSADSAQQANQLASSAAEVAARGGHVVSQVVTTMDDINTSSKQIADIISVIDGIAFQTNILALNAAVEAARAGEQGRGFAVVAGEVRALAQRSATAAREIKSLIGGSVERVEAGSRLVADAGATMQEIVQSVQRVSHIIGEITTAVSEQSGGIDQINGAVSQLDRMTQENSALVEQSAAAAESLKGQAQQLAEAMQVFQLAPAASHAAA